MKLPEYRPNAQGEITCSDFFGGDLAGITEKLDYLSSLGVTTLYLCPIFEASTNHRYDTACYERIDPLLGTEEDFRTLCAKGVQARHPRAARRRFQPHGAKKRLFQRRRLLSPTLGAAQGEQSPYYRWYSFHPFPDDYDAWWGIKNLPAVNETEKSYVDYIIEGEHLHHPPLAARGRVRLAAGRCRRAARRIHRAASARAIEEEHPDGYLLGEVWEDGTTKIAYSKRRKYLLGRETHGLMNYPFRTALLDFPARRRRRSTSATVWRSCASTIPRPPTMAR